MMRENSKAQLTKPGAHEFSRIVSFVFQYKIFLLR